MVEKLFVAMFSKERAGHITSLTFILSWMRVKRIGGFGFVVVKVAVRGRLVETRLVLPPEFTSSIRDKKLRKLKNGRILIDLTPYSQLNPSNLVGNSVFISMLQSTNV